MNLINWVQFSQTISQLLGKGSASFYRAKTEAYYIHIRQP